MFSFYVTSIIRIALAHIIIFGSHPSLATFKKSRELSIFPGTCIYFLEWDVVARKTQIIEN